MSATTSSVVGRAVICIDDDRDVPLFGTITGQLDEDRVEVAWGDERFRSDPRVRIEALDELAPASESAWVRGYFPDGPDPIVAR